MSQSPPVLRHIRKLATQGSGQPSDGELLQQFVAERDADAFAALVRRHGAMVLAVSRGVLAHQQDAEDVFQAAFFVLARKAGVIRKHESLASWLHGVAYRLALKMRSRTIRHRETPIEDAHEDRRVDDLTVRELRAILHEELHRLPEKYRAALLLCYWEGKTRDEAAEHLGITPGAFKKCLERARGLLGGRLTLRGLVPSAALFAALFATDGARAAISNPLIQSTTQAAVLFAIGKSAGIGASASAVAFAEGVLRTMTITKWATVFLWSVLVAGLGAGASWGAYYFWDRSDDAANHDAGGFVLQKQAAQPVGQATDKKRLLGTWKITSGRVNGENLPVEATTLMRFEFGEGGKFTMHMVVEAKQGKYEVVGEGKIDLTLQNEKGNSLGIYKFDGDDRLTLCAQNAPGEKRPTEFSGEKGNNQILFNLQRAKPGEEKPSKDDIARLKGGVDKVREAAARAVSANNLKQIAIAFHNYHGQKRAFPAHAIYSKDGKTPLLSWRVAILPYIEQEGLYKQFKLDESWDSAHNKKLIAKMPKVYESPVENKRKDGMTFYQVFSGPDTVFDGPNQMKLQGITDGTSNTIMAVEAKNGVTWTKPEDVTMPKDKDKLPAVGGLFTNGFNVLFCDGSVRFITPKVSPQIFRGLVTPAGGEVLGDLNKEVDE